MLESKDILLRPFIEDDLEKWTSWFNDKNTTMFMNKAVFPNTIAQQKEHLENSKIDKNNIQLAVVLKEDNQLIGSIGLHKIDWTHKTGDISIIIGEKIGLGRGAGKEAINLLVHHAFLKVNLRKITAGMWSENIGSKKAFESNGFLLEGIRKEQYEANGKVYDCLEYGLLKRDWEIKQNV